MRLGARLGNALGLVRMAILAAGKGGRGGIAVGYVTTQAACGSMTCRTDACQKSNLFGVARRANFPIRIRCRVRVMARHAIAVWRRRGSYVLESTLVALHARILVRVGAVNLVTLGALLVRFRAARQQRYRLGLVALHATTALRNPSVRRVTTRTAAMPTPLRAHV